jgi:hypothetical protein
MFDEPDLIASAGITLVGEALHVCPDCRKRL